MNECYALDPRVSVNSRELNAFLQRFGLREGRFLSDYPAEGWRSQLEQHIQHLPDVERQRIRVLVDERHIHSLIPLRGAQYRAAMDWERNAHAIHARPGVWREVFGREGNPFGWRSVGDVLDETGNDLPDGRGDHIPMKAEAYAKCIEPLFIVSEEVTLVDPYFYLADKDFGRTKVLDALLELANQTPVKKIRLICEQEHISTKMRCSTTTDFQRAVDRFFSAGSRPMVSVHLRDKAEIGHGRYIFSCHGGLQFDHGFEEHRQKRNHVHWLSERELIPIQKHFAPDTRR